MNYSALFISALSMVALIGCGEGDSGDSSGNNADSFGYNNDSQSKSQTTPVPKGLNGEIIQNKIYIYENVNAGMDYRLMTVEESAGKYCQINFHDIAVDIDTSMYYPDSSAFVISNDFSYNNGIYSNTSPTPENIELGLSWALNVKEGSYIAFEIVCDNDKENLNNTTSSSSSNDGIVWITGG